MFKTLSSMRNYYFILAGLIALAACHKSNDTPPVTEPLMDYIEFNKEIPFGQTLLVDVDSNSSADFIFYTTLVGDPILQRDYRQFHIGSSIMASLAVDSLTDQTPVLSTKTAITPHMQGVDWYNASGIWLTRKVMGATGAPFWEGPWKDARHQYLAIRVTRADLNYYGWLEVSFDPTTEKMILHRSALCREAGREVKAGL